MKSEGKEEDTCSCGLFDFFTHFGRVIMLDPSSEKQANYLASYDVRYECISSSSIRLS
jgi:hypothetical protein